MIYIFAVKKYLKMEEKNESKNNHEEEIIKIMKEVCGAPNLKPEDWHKYESKVINI